MAVSLPPSVGLIQNTLTRTFLFLPLFFLLCEEFNKKRYLRIVDIISFSFIIFGWWIHYLQCLPITNTYHVKPCIRRSLATSFYSLLNPLTFPWHLFLLLPFCVMLRGTSDKEASFVWRRIRTTRRDRVDTVWSKIYVNSSTWPPHSAGNLNAPLACWCGMLYADFLIHFVRKLGEGLRDSFGNGGTMCSTISFTVASFFCIWHDLSYAVL